MVKIIKINIPAHILQMFRIMKNSLFGFWSLPITSGFIGIAAWSGDFRLLLLLILIPAFWVSSLNRWHAAFVILVYYLTASRGLPAGAAVYFDSPFVAGTLLWIIAGFLQSIVWLVLWRPSRNTRAFLVPVILVILAIPPFGIVGWASPLTAAGTIFPSLGFAGLVLTLVLITALSLVKIRLVFLFLIAIFCSSFVFSSLPDCPDLWVGIDTHQAFVTGNHNFMDDYNRNTSDTFYNHLILLDLNILIPEKKSYYSSGLCF